jgi:hypothetical protein
MRSLPAITGPKPAMKCCSNAIWNKSRLLFVFCCLLPGFCRGQAHDVVCRHGVGKFQAKLDNGLSVYVGPATNGLLERRVCTATLDWGEQVLPVVAEASAVDIDILEADLSLGTPIVAFQVEKPDSPSRMAYEIYSLQKPPRLVRTIAGGDFFSAADSDLDGRVEIWTHDASAADGFERLDLDDFDFAPTVVLRFEGGRLTDVSSAFSSRYDQQIVTLRAQLGSEDLSDFKNSDGRLLAASSLPAVRQVLLRNTKIKVLEIVWSYLYSGREREAWSALAEMWPAADLGRIRAAILDSRTHGIRAQVDDTYAAEPSNHPLRKHANVYDTPDYAAYASVQPHPRLELPAHSHRPGLTDTEPQPIVLRSPPPPDVQQSLSKSEALFDLVIDAAGKVWSAKPSGRVDKNMLDATVRWKFIPAFKNGHAVACRVHLAVFFYQ